MIDDSLGQILGSRDAALLAAMLVISISLNLWLGRQWLSSLKATDLAKDARLADVREFAKISEDLRNVMSANTAAIKTVLDFSQSRERT